jgi:hypothetical protein
MNMCLCLSIYKLFPFLDGMNLSLDKQDQVHLDTLLGFQIRGLIIV